MIISGKARIGRDAVLKDSGNSKVTNLTLAFNYGRKDDNGNYPTQWIDASLWGRQAESLVQYLTKGREVNVVVKDPHVETFSRQDGTVGYKLAGMVIDIELGSAPQQQASQAPRPAPAPAPARAPAPAARGGADDDIPF